MDEPFHSGGSRPGRMCDDAVSHRGLTRRYGRAAAIPVLLVVAACALSACSSGPAASPPVASLGTNGAHDSGEHGDGTTTTPQGGNATHLMDEWAACMRTNGDPDQTDPTIDQYGVINITIPDSVTDSTISSEAHGSTGPCSQYELAAENVVRGGQPAPAGPTQAQLVQYTDCMRVNGVPNYPDPGPDGRTDFRGTGVDPDSPAAQRANDICGKQINAPAWWIAGTGPPGDVVVTSAGLSPGGGGPPPKASPGSPVPGSRTNAGSDPNG